MFYFYKGKYDFGYMLVVVIKKIMFRKKVIRDYVYENNYIEK